MAAPPQGVWAIDIGQCALKALRVELTDDHATATAFDYIEHPKILSQPDAEPDLLTREALEKFLSNNSLKKDKVIISIPGQSGLARFVKLPPVEEKKIDDIVKFEAKQQIPFPLEEVVWDYQKIGAGIVTDGFAMETEIGLFAMKRDLIARYLQPFTGSDIEVHIVQLSPLALANYVIYDCLEGAGPASESEEEEEVPPGKKRCVVGLDIGTDASSLVITDGAKIIWQRPIPIGGSNFTKVLTKDMKLTFAKAEHLKRNASKSPDLGKILKSLKPVLTDFVNEVQRSLGYFTNTHRDAHVSYMVGLGSAFKLPGLQKFLAEKLSLDVRKPSRLERLYGESVTSSPLFIENILSFPVVYGLGLQGVGQGRIQTNLLPHEIRFDRAVRAKKPWAVATAASLLLGTSILAAGYARNVGQVSAKEIEVAMKNSDSAISAANNKNREFEATKKTVDDTTRDVKNIIAGTDEKSNWLMLNEFINKCLPQSDGTNILNAGRQDYYFRSNEAINAAKRQKQLMNGDAPPEAVLEDALRVNLAQIELEGVNCMWCPNLEAFFNKAKETTASMGDNPLGYMLPEDKEKPPTGAGWVVEIRGTTMKADKDRPAVQFIKDTFLLNLATRERTAPAPAPTTPPAPGQPAAPPAKEHPIKGKITHVFYYSGFEDKEPAPGVFKFINQTYLPPLVAVEAAAAPGLPGAPPVAPGGEGPSLGGAGAPTWRPLGSGPAGAAPTAGPGPLLGGGGRGGEGPVAAPPPAPPSSPSATPNKNAKPRFEFVIMFVWKEPTPSDRLLEGSPAGAPGAPRPPAAPGAAPPPPGVQPRS
jgi:type IV pilus assembly protein PilM